MSCVAHEPVKPGLTIVAVSGAADRPSVPELQAALAEALAPARARVIVDLSEASFVSSAMLGLLTSAYHAADGDGRVRLAVVRPRDGAAQAMFEITALDDVLPIVETRQAALAALDGG